MPGPLSRDLLFDGLTQAVIVASQEPWAENGLPGASTGACEEVDPPQLALPKKRDRH